MRGKPSRMKLADGSELGVVRIAEDDREKGMDEAASGVVTKAWDGWGGGDDVDGGGEGEGSWESQPRPRSSSRMRLRIMLSGTRFPLDMVLSAARPSEVRR